MIKAIKAFFSGAPAASPTQADAPMMMAAAPAADAPREQKGAESIDTAPTSLRVHSKGGVKIVGHNEHAYAVARADEDFNIVIPRDIRALVIAAGRSIARGTVVLPEFPVEGQRVQISAFHVIAGLDLATSDGAGLAVAAVRVAPGAPAVLVYEYITGTWV